MPIDEQLNQDIIQETVSSDKEIKLNFFQKIKQNKLFLIYSTFLLVIFFCLLGILVTIQYQKKAKYTKSLTSPTPTPNQQVISPPSIYATDSAILLIENEVGKFQQDLQVTDLKLVELNPPNLDLDIKF